jgi:hypothetical protein
LAQKCKKQTAALDRHEVIRFYCLAIPGGRLAPSIIRRSYGMAVFGRLGAGDGWLQLGGLLPLRSPLEVLR